jgi:hypothetical protein
VVQAETATKYDNLSHVFKEKVEEIAFKQNVQFTPSNGFTTKFKKCAGHRYKGKSKSINDEK